MSHNISFIISEKFLSSINDEVLIDQLDGLSIEDQLDYIPRVGEFMVYPKFSETIQVKSRWLLIERIEYLITEDENTIFIECSPCLKDGTYIKESDIPEFWNNRVNI